MTTIMGNHRQIKNGTGEHTKQALRASELSYRRLFETAKDCHLRQANPPCGRIFK